MGAVVLILGIGIAVSKYDMTASEGTCLVRVFVSEVETLGARLGRVLEQNSPCPDALSEVMAEVVYDILVGLMAVVVWNHFVGEPREEFYWIQLLPARVKGDLIKVLVILEEAGG
jgi:hypothetical protein